MDSECVNCDDLARENVELRARIAAVLALCDDRRSGLYVGQEGWVEIALVRAAAAGDDQTTHAETHSEDTMFKVRDALRCAGLREIDIVDAVMEMQNAGILFRERAAAAGDDRATTTYRLDGTPNLRHISHPAGDGAAGDDRVGDQ